MTTIPKLNDLTGQAFGRLAVIERDSSRKGVYWLCRCECGNVVSVQACHLMSGRTKSCGCLNPPKNQKECVVCGALFYAPPSSKKVTCGDECRRVRKVWIYLHGKRPESTKAAISAAKKGKRPPTYDAFIAANKASEKTQRTEMNSAAKLWRIRNIDSGEEYVFVNLSLFIRTHPDLFGIDPKGDAEVHRVAAGFHTIKRNLIAGKSCITYKHWQITDFDDRPNWKVGYERSFENEEDNKK